MDYAFIESKILNVFIECHITSFPIHCFQLLELYGFKLYSYTEVKKRAPELYILCSQCSDDAFIDKNTGTVIYNNTLTAGRIRFSLMHELGHHVLGHIGEEADLETEANYFASHLLAPRMAIHYAGCKNFKDVARCFDLTYEASAYAFDDYRRWRRNIASRRNKITENEKKLYDHFYSHETDCFVWKRHICEICQEPFFNQLGSYCDTCQNAKERMQAYDQIILNRLRFKDENALSSSFLSAEYLKTYGHDL